ncbi:MAG: porin family protein [Flavobacteriaceae bacterium]
MKKLVITCFLMMVSLSGFSQTEELTKEKKTTFGITGGFNQDFFTSSPYRFNGLNIYGGFFVERKLSEKFGLQLELLHTKTQGSGYNTVEIPLLVKYKLTKRLSFYTGAQFNLSYRDLYIDDVSSQKPGNLAFNIGIQYDVSDRWYLFARYVHNTKKHIVSDGVFRMKTIRVGVGYRF